MVKSKKTDSKNKIYIVLVVVMLLFLLAVGFLIRWQIVRGEELKTRAMNQSLRATSLTATRGTIYDATGDKILAQSASVWTVALEPLYIKNNATRELIATGLSEILDMDKEKVLAKTKENYYFSYLKRKVETETRDKILKYLDDNDISRGVILSQDYKRYYPYGSTASVVIGFTGTENTGLAGLEFEYEKELTGVKGKKVSSKNAIGTDMPFQYEQFIPAESGYNLVLTIDETVQSIVEKYLVEGATKYKVQNGSAAVLMNVNTGAILALAVSDNFDLNDPFTLVNKAAIAKINKLPDDEQDTAYSAALSKQWRNKAVSDAYYPGSVFKMATAAMALDNGSITLETTFDCSGSYNPGGDDEIQCWVHPNAHGSLDVRGGICNSCNPFFMQVAGRMGAHDFFKYFEAFGFTSRTGIDLPGEATSIYHNESALGPVELAVEGFGQNFSISPIQMITAASAIANGGYIVQPHVVKRTLDQEGNIIETKDTAVKRQIISKEVSKEVTSMLLENVATGSGANGNVAGYRVAGKTGTSEKVDKYLQDKSKGMAYIASFCGFAPADDPEYALLVFFDEPTEGNASGGMQAAPVFANIMREVLPYLGIESQMTSSEFKENQRYTPNLVGKTIKEAKAILEADGLYSGIYGTKDDDDDIVLAQIPSIGSSMPAGGKVILCTTEEIKSKDLVTVPDFTNNSISEANDIAAELDIQVIMTGAETSGDLKVQNQDTPSGEKVKPGSVITLTIVDQSNTE